MFLETVGSVFYISSPAVAFAPQIWRGAILFSPLLSLLTIISNIVKIFHFQTEHYSIVLLYQFILLVMLHFYLIHNYRLPLQHIERRIFRPEVCLKHGLMSVSAALVAGAVTCVYIMLLFGYGFVFGRLASALDVFITFLQLIIYKNTNNKPSELFATWIVGDLVKLLMMTIIYKAPIAYNVSIVIQLLMNAYVLFS